MPLDDTDKALIATIIAEALAGQQEVIKKTVSEQANGAITKALKPIREKLDMTATKEDAESAVAARLAAIEEERAAKGAAAGKDPKDVELETLKARLDASEKKSLKDAQERKDNEAKARRIEERSATQAALTKANVIPHLVTPALASLFERGSITRDKDGSIVFTRKGEFGEEQLSLDDGIAEYLKTPEGMSMLPPRDAGGSGDPKGGKRGTSGGKPLVMDPAMAAEIIRGMGTV
jgi:hypothetical protein